MEYIKSTDNPMDDFSSSKTKVLVDCQHCGKQHPFPVENWLILQFITNTECTFCGKILAKIVMSFG